jgi:hypothetical protein
VTLSTHSGYSNSVEGRSGNGATQPFAAESAKVGNPYPQQSFSVCGPAIANPSLDSWLSHWLPTTQ